MKSKIYQLCTLFFVSVMLIISGSTWAQEIETNKEGDFVEERGYKVRPIRLGLKIGFPNLVGGNLEYVTPLFGDKLAVNLDYSSVKSDWFMSEDEESDMTETTELNFSYLEGGINYYLFKAGKGLYAGASYGTMKFEGQTSVYKDEKDGTGSIDFSHATLNVKLGAKLGGLFYFRPEIGYSFSSLPKTIDYQVNYEDGSTETETYDFSEEVASADILFKGLIANIGFGFAF